MKQLNFLTLLNGALATDIVVILLLLFGAFQSPALRLWYKKFGLGAMISDVLILVIGVLIAYYIYSRFFNQYSLWMFVLIAVVVQLLHDTLFGVLMSMLYKGNSEIMDVFKKYIAEKQGYILLADAAMIVSTVLLESQFAQFSQTSNIIGLIVLVYLSPYLVFSV
jgi:hypothetical protein